MIREHGDLIFTHFDRHWVVDSPIDCHKNKCAEMAKRCMAMHYQGKNQEIGKYDETWVQPEEPKQESPDSSETGSSRQDSSEMDSNESDTSSESECSM
jgi:hypothetical protein